MTPQPHTQLPDTPRPHTRLPRAFEVEDILAEVRRKARKRKEQKEQQAESAHDNRHHDCPIAPRELPAGTCLNGYTLSRVLGAGGFAVTYLAIEDATGQEAVIKEHFPEYLCYRESGSLCVQVADEAMVPACEAARAGFMREHRLLSTLQHPHIPRASACFEANNTACYATEFIRGLSLSALREVYNLYGYPMQQQEVYATLVRLLDALAYLHGKGLLHRDIKPENILITREGLPMLIDFGAAHDMNSREPAYVVETPGFTPAEQSRGQGLLGPWTDIYALGATFYYLLSGKILPSGRQRELVDPAEPLVQQPRLRALYHPRLLASIDRATRPHAHERYCSVSAWFDALRP